MNKVNVVVVVIADVDVVNNCDKISNYADMTNMNFLEEDFQPTKLE